MSVELQTLDERPSTEDGQSSLSPTATAVNSPATPHFPQGAARSDSCVSSSDSSDSDDEDDDESENGNLPKDSIQGWPQLAQLMAKTPDFAAFPRFRDLNVKSLLYYQCELNSLQEKLHRLEYADKANGKDFATDADELIDEGTASEQFRTMQKIRKVLKEYNPEPFNMHTLRRWLRHERCGAFKVRDHNGIVTTWGKLLDNPEDERGSLWSQFGKLIRNLVWMRRPEKSELDLALAAPQTQVDGLTHWVASELIPFRRALKKKRKDRTAKKDMDDVERNAQKKPQGKATAPQVSWPRKVKREETLVSWSENSALRLTSGISTVVACLLPVIAISVLSQLQGMKALLLCLAGFSLVFAVGLIALTQGTSSRL
ncbi:hypothetical protein N0V90_000300 [Kalmusia sp. IMI 367209]|nr:hypothetical protein N0V90_000300 [Kalmusia sp. IMI 367209]